MLVLMLRNKGMTMILAGLLFVAVPRLVLGWLGFEPEAGAELLLRLFGLLGAAMGVTLFVHAAQGIDNFRRGEAMSFVAADMAACITLVHLAMQGAMGWLGYVLALTYLSSIGLFGYVLLLMRRATRS